jgi:DNA-directed RNA polymerase I subunit RPA2
VEDYRAEAAASEGGAKKQKKVHGTDFVFEKEQGMVKGGELDVVAVPFVFRLLVAELAAMGIQVSVRSSIRSLLSLLFS